MCGCIRLKSMFYLFLHSSGQKFKKTLILTFALFSDFRPLCLPPGSQIHFMTLSNHPINISCFSFYLPFFFVYCLVTLAPLLMNCDVKAAGKSKFHCRSMSLLEPVSNKYYTLASTGSHEPIIFYYYSSRSIRVLHYGDLLGILLLRDRKDLVL